MDTKGILDYLAELEKNNNREWYHSHKEEYKRAYTEFLEIIQALMLELGKEEPDILRFEPKELTFKLVRDTRFSKDKSPYNPVFRAHISAGGKLPVPVGYFLVMQPGNRTFLGGGFFADMFKDATGMIRDAIRDRGDEWEEIITNPLFKSRFQVQGNALKNVPQGYDKNHAQAEYLKNKSWYLEYFLTDREVEDSAGFIQKAVETYRLMQPFHKFLNGALKNFEMPKRP